MMNMGRAVGTVGRRPGVTRRRITHCRPVNLHGLYRRKGMPHHEIDGVAIWYEEHGDASGPPLVALHGGILTFHGSFGYVLPWLSEGRRVIGVDLQGMAVRLTPAAPCRSSGSPTTSPS